MRDKRSGTDCSGCRSHFFFFWVKRTSEGGHVQIICGKMVLFRDRQWGWFITGSLRMFWILYSSAFTLFIINSFFCWSSVLYIENCFLEFRTTKLWMKEEKNWWSRRSLDHNKIDPMNFSACAAYHRETMLHAVNIKKKMHRERERTKENSSSRREVTRAACRGESLLWFTRSLLWLELIIAWKGFIFIITRYREFQIVPRETLWEMINRELISIVGENLIRSSFRERGESEMHVRDTRCFLTLFGIV